VPKPKLDKSKYSKAGKEQHPVKVVSTKRPVTKPPAKDKAVLSSLRCTFNELGDRVAPPPELPSAPSVLSSIHCKLTFHPACEWGKKRAGIEC
jgi:E3 ubiquitin-protein ligase HECTD4